MSAGRTVVAIRSDVGLASPSGRSGPAQTRPPEIQIITSVPRELARVPSWLTQASRAGTHLRIVTVRASDPEFLSRDESFEYEHPEECPLEPDRLTGHAERPIRRHQSPGRSDRRGDWRRLRSRLLQRSHGPRPDADTSVAQRDPGFPGRSQGSEGTLGELFGDRQSRAWGHSPCSTRIAGMPPLDDPRHLLCRRHGSGRGAAALTIRQAEAEP